MKPDFKLNRLFLFKKSVCRITSPKIAVSGYEDAKESNGLELSVD